MAKGSGDSKSLLSESDILFLFIGIIMLVVGGWLITGPYVSAAYGFIRRLEMMPFQFVSAYASSLYQKMVSVGGKPLPWSSFTFMLSETGQYVRWLWLPLPMFLGWRLLSTSRRTRYSKAHTMDSLAKQEVKLWPEITPIVGIAPDLLVDKNEAWAPALTEWEFVRKHQLVAKTAKEGMPGDTQKTPKLDEERATRVFSKQLGSRWTGWRALPPHRKAVFAALVLFVVGKRADGLAKLRLLARTSTMAEGIDVSFADKVLEEHAQHPMLAGVYERHAYVLTVLATTLQLARAKGVVASSTMLWCKPVDRELWYMLNNVGRYAFHAEIAGAAAHWLFEKTVGKAVPSPMVAEAVKGLKIAMSEYSHHDESGKWYH